MRLPNAADAVVEVAKVRDYLLSDDHRVGRFKAAFFRRLGYSADGWEELSQDLKRLAGDNEANLGESNQFGQKYEVRGVLTGPQGKSATVLTVWIVLRTEGFPRFVTAFPGKRR